MYRANNQHRQMPLMSSLDELPEKLRQRLEGSWAGTFYREVFCRIAEEPFGVLYSQRGSRPNIAVNVLVGLETLKAGFGWSDEEMYEAYCYDVQVRYALGYRNLREGQFELRTMYNFRRRLSEHQQASGDNLLERAFEAITDQQVERLAVKTGKLRMDSTQVMSNIRQYSRLQLLVEIVQRVERMLSEADRARYTAELGPYVQGSAGQYCYRVKAVEQAEHVQRVGQLMARLVEVLALDYGQHATYQMLLRVFHEHFVLEAAYPRARTAPELDSHGLQTPDDPEATYRVKRQQAHWGYAANLTETCDPDNPVQLILAVQVAPNVTDDAQFLADALPRLVERTQLTELHVDGNYNSPGSDDQLRQAHITLIPTAIRGGSPTRHLGLDQFDWRIDDQGWPQAVICPHGQEAPVLQGTANHFRAEFDAQRCATCPLRDQCPSIPRKRRPVRILNIKKRAFFAARHRQHITLAAAGSNLRVAVEASIRSLKHPFPASKLPVRGRKRVAMLLLGSALMTNLRRIWRYESRANRPLSALATSLDRLFSLCRAVCCFYFAFLSAHQPVYI
jgi:hypothetical protein